MKKKVVIGIVVFIILVIASAVGISIVIWQNQEKNTPSGVLAQYFDYLIEADYEAMYGLITEESKRNYDQEHFIERLDNIYSGIEMQNMQYEIVQENEFNNKQTNILYHVSFDTIAGKVQFENVTAFTKNDENMYQIEWSSNMIFPRLNNDDKLRVETIEAKRGEILDRNGNLLAGEGVASSVGLVPGKMSENREADLAKIAELLNISVESIEQDLSASYVKEDTFVPIKTIAKSETQIKEELLQISGIMITDKTLRVYPYKEATSHLVRIYPGDYERRT